MGQTLEQCRVGENDNFSHQGRVLNALNCHFDVGGTALVFYYIQLCFTIAILLVMFLFCKQKTEEGVDCSDLDDLRISNTSSVLS